MVGLPLCEGISPPRVGNTPGLLQVVQVESRTFSGLFAARLATWSGLIPRLHWPRACVITPPHGRGAEKTCRTLRRPRDAG
jgi:hypothetical protein